MKRYNLGFWKFGPLEQCKDGELVKWEDAEKSVKEVEHLREQMEMLKSVLVTTNKARAENWNYYKQESKLRWQMVPIMLASLVINLILLSALVNH